MRFMMLMIPKGYETAQPGIDLDPKRVEEPVAEFKRELSCVKM
jgi:hypothetical protein